MLLAVALGIAVLLVLAVFLVFPPGCRQPHAFEANAWHTANPGTSCSERTAMIDDLLANQLVPGRARSDIEQMLGPTEEVDYWLSEAEGLVYPIDCWIDCHWLVIEFDHDNRLVRASIRQD